MGLGFQVGSEDTNDCLFVGHRIQWKQDDKRACLKDDTPLMPQMRTSYRRVRGQTSWLQSRTQFHIGLYIIADVRAINLTVRTIKALHSV